ncbi:hypothetical protein, partial [Acinetobacter baumannii]|uniref:hypothetical protein n=1 Tax=Acinetobacter baumannii TaxID=470 RepID=UPI003333E62A
KPRNSKRDHRSQEQLPQSLTRKTQKTISNRPNPFLTPPNFPKLILYLKYNILDFQHRLNTT